MPPQLFGRLRRARPSAPPLVPAGPADDHLGRLIDPEECIDRFDATYLDDLPELLRELHGLTDENVREHELWPVVRALWELAGRSPDDDAAALRLADLGPALVGAGVVDERRWTPRHAPPEEEVRQRYTVARTFRRAAAKRLHDEAGADAVEAINRLQVDYSHDVQGGSQDVTFDDLARPETGDPWTPFIIGLRERGVISADEPHLTIGPRWIGEIHYFRGHLGLGATIGLDLFSKDEELVRVGDMHEMPFEDSTFGLIYQRNTFDKSYDIRRVLQECVRVLRDGGVLISDDCYDYTYGVSPLGRTNIKGNRQVLRVLGDSVAEVLYDEEPKADVDWISRYGQLAVRIRK